jgi:hypothetical protein
VRIFSDVAVVIVVDKRMLVDRVIERECNREEQKAEDDVALLG